MAIIDAGKSIRPLSQSRKNPFAKKTSDDSSPTTPSPRGLAAFDQPKVTQTKPTTTGPSKENVKAKSTKQPTLFGMKKAAKDSSSPAPAQEMSLESQEDPLPSPAQPPKTGFMLLVGSKQISVEVGQSRMYRRRTGSVRSAEIQVSFRRGSPGGLFWSSKDSYQL